MVDKIEGRPLTQFDIDTTVEKLIEKKADEMFDEDVRNAAPPIVNVSKEKLPKMKGLPGRVMSKRGRKPKAK